MTHTVDTLIIGSGVAGLSFALRAAEVGSVAVITKKQRAESNTNYAQGGIAAVMDPDDSLESHVADTLDAGAGLCHEDAVRVLVTEGPVRVRELMEMGAEFTRTEARADAPLDLGREGGHSAHRIVHAADLTGREVERALLANVAAHPNITVFENHQAIDLITQHQLGEKLPPNSPLIRCFGAYVLDIDADRVDTVAARATVLATGGAGQVYLHTTNPAIATGDGVAMAHRAGARIANMEFIQFHPTSLYHPAARSFLISEAVRGFGGILKTKDGVAFMSRYDSRADLAPRDIVARAIDNELKRRGDDYVLLDVTHVDADKVREHFPNIYERCLAFGIDITRDPIPVVPAAHYTCGGVETDLHARTSVQGLYACGEVASTGVHGANRLASNSLLEALVFAHRGAEALRAEWIDAAALPALPPWDESGTVNADEWVVVSHSKREVQQVMWDYVGIVRSDLRLDRAARRVKLLAGETAKFYRRTRVAEGLIELRNLVEVAGLIVRSAQMRKESRGLHYTTDYPEPNDAWLQDTIL